MPKRYSSPLGSLGIAAANADDNRQGYISPAPPAGRSKRTVTLLQDAVNVHETPSPDSFVKAVIRKGSVFYLYYTVRTNDRDWFGIRDTSGIEGFVPGDVGVADVVKRRFRIERVAFIATASIVLAVLSEPDCLATAIGGSLIFALLLTCSYRIAGHIFRLGDFHETLSVDAAVPVFDWVRFILEPLILVLVFVAAAVVLLVHHAISSIIGS